MRSRTSASLAFALAPYVLGVAPLDPNAISARVSVSINGGGHLSMATAHQIRELITGDDHGQRAALRPA